MSVPARGSILVALAALTLAGQSSKPSSRVADLAARIRTTDYEGNRTALRALYADLEPDLAKGEAVSRVRYWRGFALWRRALNGFNESAESNDLEQDLKSAAAEFESAAEADPMFVDAKAGAVSCLMNLAFLRTKDVEKQRAAIARAQVLAREAKNQDPENPRLLWVLGANLWYAPPEFGGSQMKAMETYERGLKAVRAARAPADLLFPAWGEPELLMNLAWSNLHRSTPDVAAARRYALEALRLVPNWHYLRDILMPQIRAAVAAEPQTVRE